MKKLLVLAVFAAVFTVSAEDMWLHWMVADNALVDWKQVQDETVYAKIKVDGGEYLHLYSSPDSASGLGEIKDVRLGWSTSLFAGISDETARLIVELYSDSTASADSWLGQTALAYTRENITSGGMSVGNAAVASTFISIPEPTSGLLLLLGVAGLALRRRKLPMV